MTRCCEEIHPLLFRVNEGEATPEQAMLVARHLSDCTACRITGAREKRLGEVLASELDELPVGEDFVDAVMSTLPKELPKRKRRGGVKNLRGLKLASFGGLGGLLMLRATTALTGDPGFHGWIPPQFVATGLPSTPESVAGMGQVVRIAAAIAEGLAPAMTSQAPSWVAALMDPALLAALGLAGLIVATGTSAALALAARSLLRSC